MTARWITGFAAGPAFASFASAAGELQTPDWPICADLNRVLERRRPRISNASGTPLAFVPQSARQQDFADKYEPRIFLHGEVQFRAGGWHDVFNALAWLTFPRAKAALNELHFHALESRRDGAPSNRPPLRDALTLFDESGVIVLTSDRTLGVLLRGHSWKTLFVDRRADVMERMRFYLFGHGLAEKMLAPFTGVTGRGLILDVLPEFFESPLAVQLNQVDERIAARLREPAHPLTTGELTPVPLLGIPGWCADNRDPRYYDDTAYFRPRRSG